ncbi:MAG: cupin domain-containing protein [Chloroflexia bacterium]|nr:cupin domain-containing protein [Chloroflexia bacterium]
MQPITLTDLPHSGNSYELEGTHYGGVPASLIFFNGPPGSGPRLHRHPNPELFVIEEGEATFVVDDERVTATAGQIVIAPAGVPHTFTNTGSGKLRSTDIHLSDHFLTEWLEDEPSGH